MVLGVCTGGLVGVANGNWQAGLEVVAAALLLGALLRLLLPAQRLGLLVVRSRAVDVAVLAALAVVLLLFSGIDPASTG